MDAQDLQNLKYPIGKFTIPDTISRTDIEAWTKILKNLPKQLIEITKPLNESELNYNYRPDGWTIKQVIHHLADSHMNSLIRFKLTLTEYKPTIKPYDEAKWAKLVDYEYDIETALAILNGVHTKLGHILQHLSNEDLKRQYLHPEHGKHFSVEETIGLYAWHSEHHLAHIKQALHYKGQF